MKIHDVLLLVQHHPSRTRTSPSPRTGNNRRSGYDTNEATPRGRPPQCQVRPRSWAADHGGATHRPVLNGQAAAEVPPTGPFSPEPKRSIVELTDLSSGADLDRGPIELARDPTQWPGAAGSRNPPPSPTSISERNYRPALAGVSAVAFRPAADAVAADRGQRWRFRFHRATGPAGPKDFAQEAPLARRDRPKMALRRA